LLFDLSVQFVILQLLISVSTHNVRTFHAAILIPIILFHCLGLCNSVCSEATVGFNSDRLSACRPNPTGGTVHRIYNPQDRVA
jgi:hypothetical protein